MRAHRNAANTFSNAVCLPHVCDTGVAGCSACSTEQLALTPLAEACEEF